MGQHNMTNGQRGIPVIDFSGVNDPAQRSRIRAEVAQASQTVGIFELRKTGVRPETCNEALAASREFYHLPDEEKRKCTKPPLEGTYKGVYAFQLGFKPRITVQGVENRDERFTLRHIDSNANLTPPQQTSPDPATDPTQNIWPETPKFYRQKVEILCAELGRVADDLLAIFSESLGFPSNYLREVHDWNPEESRIVNMHFYPKGVREVGVEETGLMAHRDLNVFTLVTQVENVNGLQINLGEESDWIPVLPQVGNIVVTVGDTLQIWSNGRYKSVLHRVLSNKNEDRFSCAYFLYPTAGPADKKEFIVEPLPSLVELDNGSPYRPFPFLDFYRFRFHTSWCAPVTKELFAT